MLLRVFTVSPGCIRHWEAHCMPDRSYRHQRYSPNFWTVSSAMAPAQNFEQGQRLPMAAHDLAMQFVLLAASDVFANERLEHSC